MHRLVFMGTPDFAVPALKALIASQQVVGVVTQPDRPAGRGRRLQAPPVKRVALAAGLPVYQPASLRPEAAAGPLRAWAPELIVVVAYGQILRPHILTLAPAGCLNLHASLLPRWRGASPIQHAILHGDVETGVCLMQLDQGLDTGPVYACATLPIGPGATAAGLHDALADLGAALLTKELEAILAGKLPARPQDDAQATYAPLIQKEDGRLDWRESTAALDRRLRAMTPWPGAFTTWRGQRLKIVQAVPGRVALPAGPPGLVVQHDGALFVLSGDGALRLQRLQLAGKRPVDAADFLRGQPDFVGQTVGLGED